MEFEFVKDKVDWSDLSEQVMEVVHVHVPAESPRFLALHHRDALNRFLHEVLVDFETNVGKIDNSSGVAVRSCAGKWVGDAITEADLEDFSPVAPPASSAGDGVIQFWSMQKGVCARFSRKFEEYYSGTGKPSVIRPTSSEHSLGDSDSPRGDGEG